MDIIAGLPLPPAMGKHRGRRKRHGEIPENIQLSILLIAEIPMLVRPVIID